MKMPAEVETCDNLTDAYPSVQDFNAALGGGAIALYVISALVIVALAVQFGFLTGHFLRHVPDERKARIVKTYSCDCPPLGHGTDLERFIDNWLAIWVVSHLCRQLEKWLHGSEI